jgi:copper chaperone
MSRFALTIDGMHCSACVKRVRVAIERVPGVMIDEVAVGTARGMVDDGALAAVIAAVTAAGYPARTT